MSNWRKAATTIDRVGQRGLLHSLVSMLLLHNLQQRRTERTFQPAGHQREYPFVVVEMCNQFTGKMRCWLGIPFHQFFHYFEQSRRTVTDGGDEPIRPKVGLLALPLLLLDLDREGAQTFE